MQLLWVVPSLISGSSGSSGSFGSFGSLGILGIENRKPNIFFLSFPANGYQIFIFIFIFIFFKRPVRIRADGLLPCERINPRCGRAPMSARTHSRIYVAAPLSAPTQMRVLHGRVFLPSAQTVKTYSRVKTRPRDKRGHARTSGRKGPPDDKFYRRTSV
jgi:hypothetical protein